MSRHANTEIDRVVSYIQQANERPKQKVTAVVNAVQSGDFTPNDVLREYVARKSRAGVLFPSDNNELYELRRLFADECTDPIQARSDIIGDVTAVNSGDDVLQAAIVIYEDDTIVADQKAEIVKNIVEDAKTTGIDVDLADVVSAINSYTDDVSRINSLEQQADGLFASDIETVEQPIEEKRTHLSLTNPQIDDIDTVNWYISGNIVGTGIETTYTFSVSGTFPVVAEIAGVNGNEQRISTELTVNENISADIDLLGDVETTVGNEETYTAVVSAQTAVVDNIKWLVDGTQVAANTKELTYVFDSADDHRVTAVVVTENGTRVDETLTVTVSDKPTVDITIDAPPTGVCGEEISVSVDVEVENSRVHEFSVSVGDRQLAPGRVLHTTLNHEFSETGSYAVFAEVITEDDEVATETHEVNIYPPAEIELYTSHETVRPGETAKINADYPTSLPINWDISGGEIVEAHSEYITVTPTDTYSDSLVVTAEVENDIGRTESDSVTVDLVIPSVVPRVVVDGELEVGSTVELIGTESHAEHTTIDEYRWSVDDELIGRKPSVRYQFTESGDHTIRVTVTTADGTTETKEKDITVIHRDQTTAIAVVPDSISVGESFRLDASNSVASEPITEYTWLIGGEPRSHSETVGLAIGEPGTYDITLRIETRSGSVSESTESITVRPERVIEPVITGPEEVSVGQQAEFTATETTVSGTTANTYEWSINDTPAGSGERLTQTFEADGYYTVTLTVTTTTNEEATATQSVSVEATQKELNPSISVTGDKQTGETLHLSASESTATGTHIESYEWLINGDPISTSQTVDHELDQHGPELIELIVQSPTQTALASKEIYISPSRSQPPYTPIEATTKTDGLVERVNEITTDDDLSDADTRQAVLWLIEDAIARGVTIETEKISTRTDVSQEQLTALVAAQTKETAEETRSNVSSDTQQGNTETSATTNTVQNNTDLSSEPKEPTAEKTNGVSASLFRTVMAVPQAISQLFSQSDTSESDQSDNTGASPNVAETDTASAKPESTHENESSTSAEKESKTENQSNDPSNTSESGVGNHQNTNGFNSAQSHQKATQTQSTQQEQSTANATQSPADASHGDKSQSGSVGAGYADDFIDPETKSDGSNSEEEPSPEAFSVGDSIISMPNYTQDLIDFEYVFEKNDDYIPDEVNAAGVVQADDDTYLSIARVHDRSWKIHTQEQQQQIANQYEGILAALDTEFPVQIVVIPSEYDIDSHLGYMQDAMDSTKDQTDTKPQLQYGRIYYINWLEQFLSVYNEVYKMEKYVVVKFSKEKVEQVRKVNRKGLSSQLQSIPLLGRLGSSVADNRTDAVTQLQLLRELNNRMYRVEQSFSKVGVEVERLTDREEVLSVLKRYYNIESPVNESFPMHRQVDSDTEMFELYDKDLTSLLQQSEFAHDGIRSGTDETDSTDDSQSAGMMTPEETPESVTDPGTDTQSQSQRSESEAQSEYPSQSTNELINTTTDLNSNKSTGTAEQTPESDTQQTDNGPSSQSETAINADADDTDANDTRDDPDDDGDTDTDTDDDPLDEFEVS